MSEGTNVRSESADNKTDKPNSDGNCEIIVTKDLAYPFSWKTILSLEQLEIYSELM